MNTVLINVADLKAPGSDKTWREINAATPHRIPLDSLVEVLVWNSESRSMERHPKSLRLRVTKHSRDCDQTPLYGVSHYTSKEYQEKVEFIGMLLDHHGLKSATDLFSPPIPLYGEESLKVIALPEDLDHLDD